MIKAVIFDFDGTVANTLPDLVTAVNGLRRHYGLYEVDEEYIFTFVNEDTAGFVRASVPGIGADKAEEAYGVFQENYTACYLDKTRPYDGIVESLDELKKRGIKLALFSNKADNNLKALTDKLFPNTFDVVLGAGIYQSKPAPDGAFAILKELGADVSEAVFVGDSDVDAYTAKNSGIRFVGASWGYRGEKFLTELGIGCVVRNTTEMNEKILNT